MAKKSNIRSMRFSDTMIEMIEAQVGDTFTAKFEALVTRCMWELPAKEKELKTIQERIDWERKRLKRIQEYATNLERSASSIDRKVLESINLVNQGISLLKHLLKEAEKEA